MNTRILNDIKKLSSNAQTKLSRRIPCHVELLASKNDVLLLARNILQVLYANYVII